MYDRGEGDHHDPRYNEFGRSAILASSEEGWLNNYTDTYTLSIYPNERLYDAYSTNNPMVATIGAVLIILFTSLLFFAYDHFVRKDMTAKKHLLDAKRQFVRFVSHEVRTPLNSVCMGLILLQEEIARSLGFHSTEAMLDADEETRLAAAKKNGQKGAESWFHLAYEVQTNAQSSVDVLDDLLNYDKIEAGTLMLELTKVDVWELVAKTVVEFKLPVATKKITLDLQLPVVKGDAEQPSFLPPGVREQKVVGDCVRITQVLRNLVSNALKFTPEGGQLHVSAQWIERSITAGQKVKDLRTFELSNSELITAPKSGMLEVKVTDTGAGMSTEQLAKLFRQGMQFNVNELQAGQGSGLGLYIAKGIVEQHGGKLTACSEGLGCGTTFTMTIPLYHIPELEKTESQSEFFSSQNNSFRESTLNVLIVDDATSNRKLLRRLLENRGHTCDEAEDGHVAVEMVQQAADKKKPYDMVLLDYEMPIMNGPTAAMEIRKIGSDAFVIGITGNMMAEDVAYFKSKGANAVLPKPFRISSLEELCVEYAVCGANWKV
jgi:signal transduction histidine kinase/ActR/RegA family two-component response regulator